MVGYSKIQHLVSTITTQFKSRTETEGRKHGIDYGITLNALIDNNTLWLSFLRGSERHDISIPMPFTVGSVELIQANETLRSTCNFWLEDKQEKLDYIAAMYYVVVADIPESLISKELIKPTTYLQQMIYGFRNNNASVIAYRFQRAINEVVNRMPIHETFMNSYVMNNRLMIIDKEFEGLASPADRLNYHVEKSKKYFDRGWTSIGLSDGSLSDKNYILKVDLRKLSPFGTRYHNPQRNLYSTLGMKGDELPAVRSQSMQNLVDIGVTRHGWNLFTAFVDIPDVFEDQIMVDESLLNKSVKSDKRYQIYGQLLVKNLDTVKTGDILGIAPDGIPVIFKTKCDSAYVNRISESSTFVSGAQVPVFNVVITYSRLFRDGMKITNLHGNKGVIRIANLGYATNPITKEKRKIEVIVGAKTVGKRRNYGQVMEALINTIVEADNSDYTNNIDSFITLEDDWAQPIDQVSAGLERRGFNKDGTWECNTYVGKLKAVCGRVFWGCIKTAEDQIWDDDVTVSRNNREIRTAGLKFSHVEFRAIETIFGTSNPILDEILSYSQGIENLHEMLEMLYSKVGKPNQSKYVLTVKDVKPVDQKLGTIITGQQIAGTVVDESFFPSGFLLNLPLPYQSLMGDDGLIIHEGSPAIYETLDIEKKSRVTEIYTTNSLYIPSGVLRRCWRHGAGKYGLSDIGVLINNIIIMSHRVISDPNDSVNHRLYYSSISTYFNALSKMLGTKTGDITNLAMSVRYPLSAKAVAVLSTTLPKNTIEIHRSMANTLKVKNDDIVLVERFPCLGFMSVRVQKVKVTDDPLCMYVIRVSGNSLVSQNLDHDGDVLFVASFHTPASKIALSREWHNPNKTCYSEIQKLNNRKGAPHIKEFKLQDFNISQFEDVTRDDLAAIVEKNTGVKSQTGPVIALTYNIMRIVENSDLAKDQKMKVAIEMFLEKAAQSVFEQKHGGKSLYEIVIDGVCTADIEMLTNVGFKRGTTEKLCKLIIERANSLGVFDLKTTHEYAKKAGSSNIINNIVRSQNKIYYASRSRLEGIALLKALEAPAVDIPSKMFKRAMNIKDVTCTALDRMVIDNKSKIINDNKFREACTTLCELMDNMCGISSDPDNTKTRQLHELMTKSLKGSYGYAESHCYRR